MLSLLIWSAYGDGTCGHEHVFGALTIPPFMQKALSSVESVIDEEDELMSPPPVLVV